MRPSHHGSSDPLRLRGFDMHAVTSPAISAPRYHAQTTFRPVCTSTMSVSPGVSGQLVNCPPVPPAEAIGGFRRGNLRAKAEGNQTKCGTADWHMHPETAVRGRAEYINRWSGEIVAKSRILCMSKSLSRPKLQRQLFQPATRCGLSALRTIDERNAAICHRTAARWARHRSVR